MGFFSIDHYVLTGDLFWLVLVLTLVGLANLSVLLVIARAVLKPKAITENGEPKVKEKRSFWGGKKKPENKEGNNPKASDGGDEVSVY